MSPTYTTESSSASQMRLKSKNGKKKSQNKFSPKVVSNETLSPSKDVVELEVDKFLAAITELQASLLSGVRDSIEIQPSMERPLDSIDFEFANLASVRWDQ